VASITIQHPSGGLAERKALPCSSASPPTPAPVLGIYMLLASLPCLRRRDPKWEETQMMKSVGSAVLLAASVLLASPAHADNQGDQFAAALAAQGIPPLSGMADLVKTAHQVCDQLGSGVPVDTVVAEWEQFANSVTPGLDPDRVHRTAIKFVRASTVAFCPGQGVGYHGRARVILIGAISTNGQQSTPDVPDAQPLAPPRAPVSAPPKKAPPTVGPPHGSGGGGGGNGGGTGGSGSPQDGPGIVTLAP